MTTDRILIVEDDADIRELLTFNLEREGFSTLQAQNGLEALTAAREWHPHLVLLDLMLPEMDGFSVCRELKRAPATSGIAILMLTARGEEVDRIVGLELGADDYVIKPFSVRELLLRIRAILRRRVHTQEQPVLERHGICLNRLAHSVTVDGREARLTATEFRLLDDLLHYAGVVHTREQLLDSVWGYQFEGYARTVDTHIRRLRAKLGDRAENLETVRGVGYRFKE